MICKRCKKEKPLTEFSSPRAMCFSCKAESRRNTLKKCSLENKVRCKLWYENNKERVLREERENYSNNKEVRLNHQASNKLWREKNKDHKAAKDKEYREKNKEKIRLKQKEYYDKNRELINERRKNKSREYYLNNKDECNRRSIEYQKKNREKMNHAKNLWRSENVEKARAIRNSSVKKWKENNPEKLKAQGILQKAVFKGIIKKPNKCSWCGKEEDDIKNILGHHTDYTKPLEVIWFCRKCHGKMHRKD